MANYLGVQCPVCSKRFAQADDIVVCPICGAPHHRECYAQRGECAFTQDHISGKEWRPPADENQPHEQGGENRETAKTCHRCGSVNPNEALFCQICGSSLTAGNSAYPHDQRMGGPGGWPGAGRGAPPNNQSYTYAPPYQPGKDYVDPYAGLNQSEKVGELSAKDVAMFVGPNHTYYLERFYQIEKHGRALQPNFAAAFLSFFFYFYRKMYKVGALMLVVFLLCMVPFFLFFWELSSEGLYQHSVAELLEVALESPRIILYVNMFQMTVFFNFIFNIVVSFSANRSYHRLAVTRIRETMQRHRHTNDYQVFLPRVGGVNRLGVVLLCVSLLVGFQVIGSALLFISSNLL